MRTCVNKQQYQLLVVLFPNQQPIWSYVTFPIARISYTILHSIRLFIKTSMSRVSNKVSSWAAFMASSKRQMCCSGFFFAVHPILLAKDSKNVLSVAGMSKVYVNPFCIILQILFSVAKIMQIIYFIKKNIKKILFYFVLSSVGTILKYGGHFIPCPISRQIMRNKSRNRLSINTPP